MSLSPKIIATSFQKMVISGQIREAYDRYVSVDFTHHNPYFAGDREALLVAMEENYKNFPNKVFEMQRVLEDGNLAAVHSRLQLQPDMPEIVTVHIFRFSDDKIVEEWDISQQVPENCPNENGMV